MQSGTTETIDREQVEHMAQVAADNALWHRRRYHESGDRYHRGQWKAYARGAWCLRRAEYSREGPMVNLCRSCGAPATRSHPSLCAACDRWALVAGRSFKQRTADMMGLPKYRCHKEVGALKIERFEPCRIPSDGTMLLIPVNERFNSVVLSPAFIARHRPEAGGYFVEYADGYQSYSPAQAFEEGYTRVDEAETAEQDRKRAGARRGALVLVVLLVVLACLVVVLKHF